MVDSIDEADVTRVDERYAEKDALNKEAVKDSLEEGAGGPNEGFPKSAREEFARRVAAKREPVRREVTKLMGKRVNPNAPQGAMLTDVDGHYIGNRETATTEVKEDGTVIATNTETGSSGKIGEIDLDKRS